MYACWRGLSVTGITGESWSAQRFVEGDGSVWGLAHPFGQSINLGLPHPSRVLCGRVGLALETVAAVAPSSWKNGTEQLHTVYEPD